MLGRNCGFAGLSLLLLAACTLDSTNPSGSGSGGMPASSSSDGATQPTTDATTSSSSGMGGMSSASGGPTTSSTDASSSTDAASSSSDASSSVSSSSGGPTDYPFCHPTTDNFDSYANDAGFVTVGEGIAGPWAEAGDNSGAVKWTSSQISTHYGGGDPGYLYLKSGATLPASGCATTVRLVSTGNAGENASFGLVDVANSGVYAQITCDFASNGTCHGLEPFGFAGMDVAIGQGVLIGIVIKNQHAFGLYNDGSGWKMLGGVPAQGQLVTALAAASVRAYFGQETGDETSIWDDFNVVPIPLAAVP